MITNELMESKDRELFGVVIRQQTKDSFVSITDLMDAYEVAMKQYGWSEQNIASLMKGIKFQERLYYILSEQYSVKVDISTFTKECKKKGVTCVLKELGLYKTVGRGENKLVMCAPYIWVLIALELNPMIYAKVIGYITDTLIFDRIEASDYYKPMNIAIDKIIKDYDYTVAAIEINKKVFGRHQTGIRKTASAKELKAISSIQSTVVEMIEMGFIKTVDDILRVIRIKNISK